MISKTGSISTARMSRTTISSDRPSPKMPASVGGSVVMRCKLGGSGRFVQTANLSWLPGAFVGSDEAELFAVQSQPGAGLLNEGIAFLGRLGLAGGKKIGDGDQSGPSVALGAMN